MQDNQLDINKKKRNNAIAFGIITFMVIVFITTMVKMSIYGINPNG